MKHQKAKSKIQKGKILKKEGVEVFYVLISSKKSTDI